LSLALGLEDEDVLLLAPSPEALEVDPPPSDALFEDSDALFEDSDALFEDSALELPEVDEALESPVLD
jgi:hypothetical protein